MQPDFLKKVIYAVLLPIPTRFSSSVLNRATIAQFLIHLKQKSEKSYKKKIATAIYEYHVEHDGEWGELSFDFETTTAKIVKLAD